jgi:hypothetical protein
VDRWVSERRTFVAEQRGRIVAAAHLLRHRSTDDVSPSLRKRRRGEMAGLLARRAPYWPDAQLAGRRLMAGCLAQLSSWRVTQRYADGSLPVAGVYGLPHAWPHIGAIYAEAGFTGGRRKTILVCPVSDLARTMPSDRLIERRVRTNGVRFSAVLDANEVRITTSLLAAASVWLRLAGIRNLLTYCGADTRESEAAFLGRAGFVGLSKVTRQLTLN